MSNLEFGSYLYLTIAAIVCTLVFVFKDRVTAELYQHIDPREHYEIDLIDKFAWPLVSIALGIFWGPLIIGLLFELSRNEHE